MARYRKIDPRIWGDEKFRTLSRPQPNAQTLWLYLLTGSHTNSCPGIFNIGEMALAENLGWSLEGLRKAFKEVLGKGLAKADFEARVIIIPNALKYDHPESPNVVKYWGKMFDEVPECALKNEYYLLLKAFMEAFGEAFGEAFKEGFRESITIPEPEPEPEPEPKESLFVSPQKRDTPTDAFINLFNSTIQYLPKVTQSGRGRTDKIKTRLKERRDLDWWKSVFEKADNILIPSRKQGERDWFPTFDWLIDNDKNAVKVFEGNYDDAKRPKASLGKSLDAASMWLKKEETRDEEARQKKISYSDHKNESSPPRDES